MQDEDNLHETHFHKGQEPLKILQWLVQIRERAVERLRLDWNRPGDWTAGNHAETWAGLRSQSFLFFPGEFPGDNQEPHESLSGHVEEWDFKAGTAVKIQSGTPADGACPVTHGGGAPRTQMKLPSDPCATEKWRLTGWESQRHLQGEKSTRPVCPAPAGSGRRGEDQH